ncbi:hypothetical protein C7M84_008705 [Penaeus vannamei]|uniref:Uncharacterized protein n=1 Tax=Penaeus vannamei TaxID=6689 RepID=A0A3R7PIC1_PENVA|nr:hypothetical protein C7M84_008705 [Penaeus vannamei]
MSRGTWMAPLALLAALFSGSLAANLIGRQVSLGICPNITNKADFDAVPYLGRWFEYERYDILFQSGMDCVNALYSDMGNGYVEVHNTARTSYDVPAEYHILDTDYENYSSVYNCFEEGDYHWQYAWLLTPPRSPLRRSSPPPARPSPTTGLTSASST